MKHRRQSKLLKPTPVPSGLYTAMVLLLVGDALESFGAPVRAIGAVLIFIGFGCMVATIVAEWRSR